MKKQHFQKKLALKATRVSNLTAIYGGNTPVRFTENPCIISDVETCTTVQEPVKLTEALRCTHTIGNGLNPDGTPCTV